ncbi:MAG: baseplate J/gp47 family protein [Fimbriimonadaceae bacterium]|nr:baseplate J/gp47 family protein [Fimbriimonadaceae bacterium]
MDKSTCGCCGHEKSLDSLGNPPGRTSISYRLGTFGTFKSSMLENIWQSPGLRGFGQRETSDATVALIDAYAVALDVLSFYQERLVNESFLGTAQERRSLVELANQIGYRPIPSTAAEAYVAFKADDSGFGPESVTIAVGNKVQSIPGQNELPQTYETVEEIVAYPEYNEIAVRRFLPEAITEGSTSAYFEGIDLALNIGDILLFVTANTVSNFGTAKFALRRVTKIERDDDRKVTKVSWGSSLTEMAGVASIEAHVMRKRASLFGYNAIEKTMVPTVEVTVNNIKNSVPVISTSTWADSDINTTLVDLDTTYPEVKAGSWVVLRDSQAKLFWCSAVTDVTLTRFLISGKATRMTIDRAASVFTPRTTVVFCQSEPLTVATKPDTSYLQGKIVQLGVTIDRPEVGRRVIVKGQVPRIKFFSDRSILSPIGETIGTTSADTPLRLMSGEIENVPGTKSVQVETEDGQIGIVQFLSTTELMLVEPYEDDLEVGEMAILDEDQSQLSDDPLEIRVSASLEHQYYRPTTRVYANVALATHGETREEVLGSGNGAAFQKFDLKSKPLTYLADASPSGYATTLQVRVNDILWKEADTLFGKKPTDRVYTTRESNEAVTTVGFGDGYSGVRPPNGLENIRAKYRVGGGVGGRVREGQLSMLLTRPLGVTEVINPLAAAGGSDPEDEKNLRENVSGSVRTLQRVVSVEDFAYQSMRLPGIAKARASWLWNGTRRVVVLCVMGDDGADVDTAFVKEALDSARDTHIPLTVMNADIRPFGAKMEILVREEYETDKVIEEARVKLLADFGFDNRAFGVSVTVAHLDASLHEVEGVEAVKITALHFAHQVAALPADGVLRAEIARIENGIVHPDDLLVLSDTALTTEEMTRAL